MAATTVREVQGKLVANECIELCRKHRVDLNLLFSLRHWGWLDNTRCGSKLKAFIEGNTSLHRQEMQSMEFRKGFEMRVEYALHKAGIQKLTPELVVEGALKQEVMDKYFAVRDSWPPHKPYLLQMRPGPYLIFADFQTASNYVREMAETGKYQSRESGKYRPVELLYEMQMEGEPCRIILDCDAYLEDYAGLLSKEELVESVLQVPLVLTRELVRIGAIDRGATVRAAVKDKSREGKVSFHFTLNIAGIPTGDMKAVFAMLVLGPYTEIHARARRDKSRVCLARYIAKSKREDGVYAHALAHIDPATVKGKHQFSLAFSRKKGEEPPRMGWVHWIMDGGAKEKRVKSSFYGESIVPSHDRALEMLYFSGFVHFTPGMLVLKHKFHVPVDKGIVSVSFSFFVACHETRTHARCTTRWQAKKRVLDQPPEETKDASASSMGAVRGRESSLPQWMKSAWMPGAGQNYSENTQMECLKKTYKHLSQLDPNVLPKDMVHVVGIPCPVSVLYGGTVSVHSSNGIFVARKLDGECDVVYAKCPHCVLDKRLLPKSSGDEEDSLAKIIGDNVTGHPWVAYTRQNYPRIVAALKGGSGALISTPSGSSSIGNIKIPKKQKKMDP